MIWRSGTLTSVSCHGPSRSIIYLSFSSIGNSFLASIPTSWEFWKFKFGKHRAPEGCLGPRYTSFLYSAVEHLLQSRQELTPLQLYPPGAHSLSKEQMWASCLLCGNRCAWLNTAEVSCCLFNYISSPGLPAISENQHSPPLMYIFSPLFFTVKILNLIKPYNLKNCIFLNTVTITDLVQATFLVCFTNHNWWGLHNILNHKQWLNKWLDSHMVGVTHNVQPNSEKLY